MNGRICRVALLFVMGFLLTACPAWSQPPNTEEQADDVGYLIEALSNPAPRIRGNAFNALVNQNPKPYDALVTVLAEKNQLPAASAALVIRELKKENASLPEKNQKALYAILYNPDTEPWRWNITATLLSGATPKSGIAVDSLKDHIDLWIWGVNHPAPLVKLPSLRALQKTGEDGQAAEHAVAALLNRPMPALTSIVVESAIITHGIIGLESSFVDYNPLTILETLVAIKADPHLMVGPLMKLTHHPSDYVRLDAAAMLGKIDTMRLSSDPRPYAAKVLAQLATLPWSKVRLEAVTELGNIGEPAACVLPVLIRLLKDGKDQIRLQAAVALGEFKAAAEPALPALEEALRLAKKQANGVQLDTAKQKTTGTPIDLIISQAIDAIKTAVKEKPTAITPPTLPQLPQ